MFMLESTISIRQRTRHSCLALLTLLFLGASFSVHAATPAGAPADRGTGKSGKSYVSFGVSMNEFRSVELVLDDSSTVRYDSDGDYSGRVAKAYFPLTGQTYAYSLTYGSYINDYFKTEIRAMKGFEKDTLKDALDINIAYSFSWYMGFEHPITDYMAGSFKYGVSYYEADITRRQTYVTTFGGFNNLVAEQVLAEPSPEFMEKDFFGTKFSPSWLLGLKFSLMDQWFLEVEYGRLLKDSDTNFKVRQHVIQLQREF